MVLLFRVLFLLEGGHPGSNSNKFILFRVSAPGDMILSLTAFLYYLNQMTTVIEQKQDFDFDMQEIVKHKIKDFGIFFFTYSTLWIALLAYSIVVKSILVMDLTMTIIFGILIIAFMSQGVQLTKTIGSYYQSPRTPQKYVITITVITCCHTFVRMIFLAMPDVSKVSKILSIQKNTDYWSYVLLS